MPILCYNKDMEFSEILTEYLQIEGLTQTQFAQKIGAKQSQVSEWLAGKGKPGYEWMKRILQNTDRPAEFWFGIDG